MSAPHLSTPPSTPWRDDRTGRGPPRPRHVGAEPSAVTRSNTELRNQTPAAQRGLRNVKRCNNADRFTRDTRRRFALEHRGPPSTQPRTRPAARPLSPAPAPRWGHACGGARGRLSRVGPGAGGRREDARPTGAGRLAAGSQSCHKGAQVHLGLPQPLAWRDGPRTLKPGRAPQQRGWAAEPGLPRSEVPSGRKKRRTREERMVRAAGYCLV